MAPPIFRGPVSKDAYEFLIDCQEKLQNLGPLESRGVAYSTYQLTDIARDWWRFLSSCRPVDLPA